MLVANGPFVAVKMHAYIHTYIICFTRIYICNFINSFKYYDSYWLINVTNVWYLAIY